VDPGDAFGIGEPAPPLAVPQLGGGQIALSNLRGTPVWVNFMASWCPPCRDELPIMNGYAARYADTGLVVLAIDVREDEAVVDAFVRELNVTFPVGLDGDGTAQSDWGAFALPVHYWIDAEGIVRDGALGGIGPDVMAEGLESILPGVEVTP
jgi:cytochrome c biogenesis protein CcmG, thiol:disulfide interchange protein DsbE